MGHELNTTYVLTGPDGTRAVFGDTSDSDFVGFLNDVTGLDSPDVRDNGGVLTEADGGVQGPNYYGRRPVTLKGVILPDPVATRNAAIDRLQQASNAMRDDAVLTWDETTLSGVVTKRLWLRRQQPTRVTGLRPKEFMVSMISNRPEIVSDEQHSEIIQLTGDVDVGRGYDRSYDYDYGGGVAVGNATITNDGNTESPPLFQIDGPVTNPILRNNTTGEALRFAYTLGAGEYLLVDVATRTILLNGTASRYAALIFPGSEWWLFQPGDNDFRVYADDYTSPDAQVTVYWRDAWI